MFAAATQKALSCKPRRSKVCIPVFY